MLINILLIAIGFFALIKGADWLVNGSSFLARKYNISELAIGLTIVAFGTSIPELVVNIFASIDHKDDIVIGSLVGSNNFNLFVILGIAAMITNLKVQHTTVWYEIPLSAVAVSLLLLVFSDLATGGQQYEVQVSRIQALMLLFGFVLFLYYVYTSLKNADNEHNDSNKPTGGRWVSLLILAGLLALTIGGKLVLHSSVELARQLGWSEKLIGLTVVAAGTSLPELVTTVVAAAKRKTDILLGNIIGSNIFNLLLIMPVSVLIHPVQTNITFTPDLAFLFFGTALLSLFMFIGKKYTLQSYQGFVLLGLYVLYTIHLGLSSG